MTVGEAAAFSHVITVDPHPEPEPQPVPPYTPPPPPPAPPVPGNTSGIPLPFFENNFLLMLILTVLVILIGTVMSRRFLDY